LMVGAFVTPVMAETTAEQEQKLNQEIEIECTTGSYGQNSTCKATASQSGEQRQRILGVFRKDGKFVPVHKPVDTGLDTATMAMVSGTLIAGSTAAFLKVKSRKA